MVYLGASGHEVEEAAVSDVPAPLELQPVKLRAVPGEESESPVRQPGTASQSDGLHRRGPSQRLLPSPAPDQAAQDGPDGLVHVQPLLGEGDGGPELWLPGESAEPPGGGGDPGEVEGGEVGEDPGQEEVRQGQERETAPWSWVL